MKKIHLHSLHESTTPILWIAVVSFLMAIWFDIFMANFFAYASICIVALRLTLALFLNPFHSLKKSDHYDRQN